MKANGHLTESFAACFRLDSSAFYENSVMSSVGNNRMGIQAGRFRCMAEQRKKSLQLEKSKMKSSPVFHINARPVL